MPGLHAICERWPTLTVHSPRLHVVAAAIISEGQCLIGKRKVGGAFAGLWEFPGGKVEAHESHEQALVREITEELNLSICVEAHLAQGQVLTQERHLILDVYLASLTCSRKVIERREHQCLMWIGAGQLDHYEWAPADLPAVAALRGILQ